MTKALKLLKSFEKRLLLIMDPDAVYEETCIEMEITWRDWSDLKAAINE